MGLISEAVEAAPDAERDLVETASRETLRTLCGHDHRRKTARQHAGAPP